MPTPLNYHSGRTYDEKSYVGIRWFLRVSVLVGWLAGFVGKAFEIRELSSYGWWAGSFAFLSLGVLAVAQHRHQKAVLTEADYEEEYRRRKRERFDLEHGVRTKRDENEA